MANFPTSVPGAAHTHGVWGDLHAGLHVLCVSVRAAVREKCARVPYLQGGPAGQESPETRQPCLPGEDAGKKAGGKKSDGKK